MATVTNPAYMSSVKSVFGGGNYLTNYRRGGAYVYGIANAYPLVATSGTIRLAAFAGTVKPTITFSASYTDYTENDIGTAYSSIRFSGGTTVNGTYAVSASGGGTTNWLIAGGGNPADYEIYFEAVSGTINYYSGLNTWLNLSSLRYCGTSRGSVGTSSGTFTATIRNAQATQYNLVSISCSTEATRINNVCPTCCFTPETLITMSDGSTKPIYMVMVGDIILTRGGSKPVTEVITRVQRVMYRIRFADGRILNASEDHPLFVVGKGYAAINPDPNVNYKDLGVAATLELGDLVMDEEGSANEIVEITEIDYPHTVYTFLESEFYANGMLVY